MPVSRYAKPCASTGAGEEPAVDAVPVEHVVALTPGRVAFVRVLGIAIARRTLDACSSLTTRTSKNRKRRGRSLSSDRDLLPPSRFFEGARW